MVRRTNMFAQSSLLLFNIALLLTYSLLQAMKKM